MRMDFSGKIAIVTGAGRGIGRGIALAFANANANVVINDVDLSSAENVAKEIEALGRRALAIKADVSKREEVEKMVEKTLKTFGKIDVLVNNAGIIVRKPAEELSEEEWDKQINVNLKGVFLCSQIVGKHMIERGGGGKIVNIASLMGILPVPPRSAYSASKAGVITLTKDLAAEWAKYNINVNAIAPGWIKTPMTIPYFAKEEVREFLLDRIPMKRFGEPEDVADLVLFLASEFSNYITGQTINLDGGWTT